MLQNPLLLCIFLIISCIEFSSCEIKDTHVVHDSRPMILFEQFGFAPNGHVSVSVNRISWKSKHHNAQLNPSSLGFFLVRDTSFPRILNESEYIEGYCMLSSHYVKLILRLDKLGPVEQTYYGSIIVDEADEYNLIFGNCQPEFQVSMNVHTEMYNIDSDGRKDFLHAGQTLLPKLYLLFFLIYSTFFAIWVFICVKQRATTDKIHLIMCALLLFKSMKVLCASEDYAYIRNTGTPHGWDVAFYFFGFFKGVTLFTVIILIGTGWSFLKPYFQLHRFCNFTRTFCSLMMQLPISRVDLARTSNSCKVKCKLPIMRLADEIIEVIQVFNLFVKRLVFSFKRFTKRTNNSIRYRVHENRD